MNTKLTTRPGSALLKLICALAIVLPAHISTLNAQDAATPYEEPPLLEGSGAMEADEETVEEAPAVPESTADPMRPRLSLMEAQRAANEGTVADELPAKSELFNYAPGLNNYYGSTGQDVIRPSVVGIRSTLERQRVRPMRDYNLKVGPVRFLFSAGVGFEYNDNINYADKNEESDFIIRPHVLAQGAWDVTPLNTLTLDIGLSYAKYIDHSQYDTNTLLISPGSQISFDIYIGDFRINLHDRFSIQQDPIDEPAVSGVVDYTRFANTAGIAVLWDLNDVQLTLGYDHFTFISLEDKFDYLNRSADAINFSAAFLLRDTLTVGVEGGGAVSYYEESYLSNSNSYHAGVFVDTILTPYIRLRAAAGYQGIAFDENDSDVDTGDSNGWYGNASIVHKISPVALQTLIVGHETQLGTFSNASELNFAQHTVVWNVIYNLSLSTDLRFEDGDETGGPFTEHYQRYGASIALSYPVTPNLRTSLRYQFLYKDSDINDRDYKQNQVLLDLNYTF